MVSMKRLFCLFLAVGLAGCVAPEAPPPPHVSPAAASKPAISTAGYEDAPLPNRKMGTSSGDSVIRVAH